MGKHIGLDIGIASVGWSVIEDDYSVIELGSNIFNSCEASNNQTRREMRQARRLLRRKKTRIKDFNKLWKKHFHEIPEKTNKEVIFLKNKGLIKGNEKRL